MPLAYARAGTLFSVFHMPLLFPYFQTLLLACTIILLSANARSAVRPEITTQSISYEPLPTTGTLTAARIGSGVWYHPEFDETSISRTMADLKRWGFRNVYVETFRHGATLHPSATFPSMMQDGQDWLQVILEHAHANDLRVIAWMHTLAWWGVDDEAAGETTHPLLSRNLHWLDVSADGVTTCAEEGLLYVSPASPGVEASLVGLVHELLQYDIDGVNLDDLRYNGSGDFGYHPIATDAFEEMTGVAVSELEPGSREYDRWVKYREDLITLLVERLSREVRLVGKIKNKRLLVTAAFNPNASAERGESLAYEDWRIWVLRGYLDASTPLCFGPSPSELERDLREVRSLHQGSRVVCVPGLELSPRNPSYLDQRRLLESVGFLHCTISDYDTLRRAMKRIGERRDGEYAMQDDDSPTTGERSWRNWLRSKLGR